jgi:hypothetical protein
MDRFNEGRKMTVKEMIEELKKYDKDLPVIVIANGNYLSIRKKSFILVKEKCDNNKLYLHIVLNEHDFEQV